MAADGKSFTLLGPPTGKNPEPTVIDVRISENTRISDDNAVGKVVAGQTVYVWLDKGEAKLATAIHIARPFEKKKPAPDEPPVKKPEGKNPEPGDKKPEGRKGEEPQPQSRRDRQGIAADGKSFTLLPAPTRRTPEPAAVDIRISERERRP